MRHRSLRPALYLATVGLMAMSNDAFGQTPVQPASHVYRMTIQSHSDLGNKCLDVPYARFVEGMRLQMWECNNSPGQTFVYDETKQALQIDAMCVESWGRGDPQDAVGLRRCTGKANQRWRMVASGDYYQIIGINSKCLELRYGVKENGAPLDIMDCDPNRAQRLWALVEAPAADRLGRVWETESSGWKGVWTRRGDTNVFDVALTHPAMGKKTTVNSVTIDGNSITAKRLTSSDGNLCTYTGTLVGTTVSGTVVCQDNVGKPWQATIH